MVKRAPIAFLKAGTVQPGRYLVLFGGSVASVQEAHEAGLEAGGSRIVDRVLLPDVHQDVYHATLGTRHAPVCEALGVLETTSVASLLQATDAAIKGTDVTIIEMRLADDLGGKAFVLLDGGVANMEVALEMAASSVTTGKVHARTIIPRLDETLRTVLAAGTRFGLCEPVQPEGAELHAIG